MSIAPADEVTVCFVPLLKPPALRVRMLLSSQNPLTRCRRSLILFLLFLTTPSKGGPPYYTNDPGTPGNLNWEINLGYMPLLYSGHSVSHVPGGYQFRTRGSHPAYQ
jgi:hypothetical protein